MVVFVARLIALWSDPDSQRNAVHAGLTRLVRLCRKNTIIRGYMHIISIMMCQVRYNLEWVKKSADRLNIFIHSIGSFKLGLYSLYLNYTSTQKLF